jgi:hypothetical protein
MLSDDVNKYVVLFCVGIFMASDRELVCHTVYTWPFLRTVTLALVTWKSIVIVVATAMATARACFWVCADHRRFSVSLGSVKLRLIEIVVAGVAGSIRSVSSML